ncbi:proteophosphoglycan ppg4 [Rhodotorula toruloides]|uniref:Proteophosphoglycan ppg4 n=1 Tax=Rhodotorula toruloides TaxID=5286 RepID=A0A511KFD5_RHOTO|nr:proteophosphoglycan ppg4 [Rhodotorula toruloides]
MAPQPAESGRLRPSSAAMSRSSTLDISVRSAEEEMGRAGVKEDVVPPLLSEQERDGGGGKAFHPGEDRRGSANGLLNGVGGSGGLASEIRDSRRPSAASSTGTSSSTRSMGSIWRVIKSRATSGSTTATTPDSTPTTSKIKAFFSSAGRRPNSTSSPATRETGPQSVAMAKSASADSAPRARRRPATSAGGGAAGGRPKSFLDASTTNKKTGGFTAGPPRLGAVQEGMSTVNGAEYKWKNPFAGARPATAVGSQNIPPPPSFARQPSSRAEADIKFNGSVTMIPRSTPNRPPRRPSTATGATGAAGLARALSFSTNKSTRSPSSSQDLSDEKMRRLPLRLKSIPSVPNLRAGSSRKREEEAKDVLDRPRVSRLPSLTGLVPAAVTKPADSTFATSAASPPPFPSATSSSLPPTAPLPAKKHVRQKSSMTALTSILKHPSSANYSSAIHDAEDPLTDEELASWRLGRSRESSVRAGVGAVGAGGTRRMMANGNGEAGAIRTVNGSRRGTAEDEADVLVIQKKQVALVAPPSPPRPSAVPLFPSSRASSFSSFRRASADLRRPKTAPENRPSRPRRSSDASSAFNVLEFVAADEGRDTKSALPMRFPQMNGDEAVFLPSAISPPMGSAPFPSSNEPRRKFLRRVSSTSSHLSLGSEEEMILSTLDGGNLSAPSSPSSAGGSSPVMFQSVFVPSGLPGAGESALPPAMRGLFATPDHSDSLRHLCLAPFNSYALDNRQRNSSPPSRLFRNSPLARLAQDSRTTSTSTRPDPPIVNVADLSDLYTALFRLESLVERLPGSLIWR